MSQEAGSQAPDVTRLAWDSEHFGFAVGRLDDAGISDAELSQALSKARADGLRLVYWMTDAGRAAPDSVLGPFGGRLVDRKATYSRSLGEDDARLELRPDVAIREYPRGDADPRLEALAIAAGGSSRYNVDPRIAKERFEELYRIWIRRSTRGELADVVLVAASPAGEPVGLVTIAKQDGRGVIGLVAVAEKQRGAGVGAALLTEAHRWMFAKGCTAATVVTQLANTAACRLYERHGYQLVYVKAFYHLWLD